MLYRLKSLFLHRWMAVFVAGLFLLLTVKPGQPWDGDGELYLRHAVNILHGAPYAATSYLVNSQYTLQPAAYPPGLPLLLVPIIVQFGIHYIAIKTFITAFFVAMLGVLAVSAVTLLSEEWIIIWILALGFNPFIWNFKDVIFSEFPFMFFVYLSLYAFDRMDRASRTPSANPHNLWPWALVAGLAAACAYEVRTIGIVLLAALATASILRLSRLFWSGGIALALAAAVISFLSSRYQADISTYLSYFNNRVGFDPMALVVGTLQKAKAYAFGFAHMMGASKELWHAPQFAALAILVALISFGLFQALRHRIAVYEIFLLFYVGALLLYPIAEEPDRYALPLLPLLLYYFVLGAQDSRLPLRMGARLGLVFALLGILYAPRYINGGGHYNDARQIGNTRTWLVTDTEAQELFKHIEQTVPPDDLILCNKPTIIAFYTQRHTTNPPQETDDAAFWDYARKTKAQWVVTLDPPLQDPLIRSLPDRTNRLKPVFNNRLATLYKIKS